MDKVQTLINELEEVISYHRSVSEMITEINAQISFYNDLTMGALLSQDIDVMAPFVGNGRKQLEEDLLYHFFHSNWLSRQVSMYRQEVSTMYVEYYSKDMVFASLYDWVSYCRAYHFNRINDASASVRSVFAKYPIMSLSMILSDDPYQFVLSDPGYAEEHIARSVTHQHAAIPKAVNLRAACYKWWRMYVLGKSNVEYLPCGQVRLVKGYVRHDTTDKVTNVPTDSTLSDQPSPGDVEDSHIADAIPSESTVNVSSEEVAISDDEVKEATSVCVNEAQTVTPIHGEETHEDLADTDK